jgi:alkanesulfonate monooxygenase SsuD/methylene tetrahydromethanopterin reductase-like flavin-dependent oxidoreductase (luciferase family)
MKLGAYFLPLEFETFVDSVRAAERAGYSNAWVCDSVMIWQDPYVYMARGLAETENLVFGTAVTNPVTRHFTATAAAHATLAQLHPGRVVLGIGRGDSSIRTLGLPPARIKEMEAVMPRLRQLMRGEALDLDGREIRITWAHEDVPVMIGGTGPRTMRMAGALADLVTLELGVNPDSIRWALDQVRSGAEEAGRDPAAIEIVVLCGMWISDDLEEAREHCRWAPASGANHIAEVMHNNPEHGMPESLTRLVERRRKSVASPLQGSAAGLPSLDGSYDYYEGHCVNEAEHSRWIPDQLIDDFTLAGPADEVAERIDELAALGVDQVAAAFLNGQLEQIELVGRELLPRLREISPSKQLAS